MEFILVPGMTHDLGGGFVVRRILPFRKKRMVGPFIFFDHMGPIEIIPTKHTDVRPHPHIGLSTLTYLFKGRIVHRDTLGNVQTIMPGEVNWMTSGRGIVHSERIHPEDQGHKISMEGLQFWVALPDETEDQEPSFDHYDKSQLPVYEAAGFRATVVAGSAFGLTSPVKVSSPLLLMDVHVSAGAAQKVSLKPAAADFEIAVYVMAGSVNYGAETITTGNLGVLNSAAEVELRAESGSHFIIIGGETIKTPRLIYWNFVSSSRDKIKAAAKLWKEEKFPLIPGDEKERIPLGS